MFRLRQHEDVHVESTDTPGVLEVRRVSGDDTRWTARLDVAATYAQRFTTPEVFAIDARIAGGELYLIAHAFEASTRRLLPPRELTVSGGQLARARPGADRHTLAPNLHVISGGIHWQVTAETATTFTLADVRTIEKLEATGPFLRLIPYRDWTIRIVQELDDHVLAVVSREAARTLGWSTALIEDTELGFRWFERGELDHLEVPPRRTPCVTCATRDVEHLLGTTTIAVERGEEFGHRLVECSACLVTYLIEETARDRWSWTPQARRNRDGTPAELEPEPAPPSAPPPGNAQIDKHAFIHFAPAGKSFLVTDERVNSIQLDADGQLVGGAKLDPSLSGPYLYWVRYDGSILRVIDEDNGLVLLACHPSMGPHLRFERVESPSHALCFKWVSRSDVEDLRTEVAKVPAPLLSPDETRLSIHPPTDATLAEHAFVDIAGYRVEIDNETEDTWSVTIDRERADPDLVAAGFKLEPDLEQRMAAPIRYQYTAWLDKRDRRVTGPFTSCVRFVGHVVRVIAEDSDAVLAVCHPYLGKTLEFHRRDRVWFRWLKKAGVEALNLPRDARVEPKPPPIEDWRVAREHGRVVFSGQTVPIVEETDSELILGEESGYANAALVALGFDEHRHETDVDTDGRKMNLNYESLRVSYTYTRRVPKLDPGFSGLTWTTWEGRLYRLVAEQGDQVLVLASATWSAGTRDFREIVDPRVCIRWVPRTEISTAVRDRAPTTSEIELHKRIRFSAPDRMFVVFGETATELELLQDSDAPDQTLIDAGFRCETKVSREDYVETTSYAHVLTVSKLDPRVVGPFLYAVRHANVLLRVIAEQGERVLVACGADLGRKLGFEISIGGWDVGWAWLPRERVERIETVRAAVKPELDLSRYDHKAMGVRLHGFQAAVSVIDETPDTFTLVYEASEREPVLDELGIKAENDYDERGGREREIYTLECAKTDPRIAVELVEYRGYQLRVIERHPYGVLAAVHQDLARLLGFSHSYAVALRWLAHHEVRAARPRTHRLEPGRRAALVAHMRVGYAPRGEEFVVRGETDDTIVLDSVGAVPKPDGRLYGNNIQWVRHAGKVLRVAQRDEDEVLVVAHRDLASDALPQIDANLCAAWVPRREVEPLTVATVAPADPDVGRLEAVSSQIGGHDHIKLAGIAEPARVIRETGNTLEVEHAGGRRETLGKADVRLRGPFTHVVAFRGVEYRVVLELDDKYLVVIHESFPEQHKFLRHRAAPGLFRWFGRSDVRGVERVANAGAEDLSRHAPVVVTIDGVAHSCVVKTEFADQFDVLLNGSDLRIDKLDPRVSGTFERIGFFDGIQVRVIGERQGQLLLVVDDSYANRSDGWERGPGLGWRLVAPDRVTDPPPSNDALYRSLKLQHAGFERSQYVLDETADTFVLETGSYTKSDPQLVGVRLVTHRGSQVRVVDVRGNQVLVVAHGTLGTQPGFTRHTYDGRTLGWAWLAREVVEPVALAPPPPATPAPAPESDEARMDAAYQELGVRYQWMYLEDETADRFGFRLRLDAENAELVAAGCSCEWGYDDRAGSDYYDHRFSADKTAREVTGAGELCEYRGYQLRVVHRRDDRVLVIAHPDLASQLGLAIHGLLGFRWIPAGEVKPVR